MELVQRRLESTLPELEEILRVGILSRNEVRQLVKRRQQFEAKLRRMNKALEDVVSYIDYEKKLLYLIKKRRERLLIDAKVKEIDGLIARKIHRLYKTATNRFPTNENLWIDWLSFSKESKWHETITVICKEMLKKNINSTNLYIVVAKYKMEEVLSPEDARKVFQQGVLHNPTSPELWKEFFRMELMNIDKVCKRKEILESKKISVSEEENDAVLRGDLANIVFDCAVEAIKGDVNFPLSFIEICTEFDFGSRHVSHIMDFTQMRYPEAEETLDALAKLPLLDIEAEIRKGKESNLSTKKVVKTVNNKVYENYETSVQSKNTEKMWSFYIDFLMSLWNCAKEKTKHKHQNRLMDVMQRAASNDCLNEVYSLQLLDLLYESGDTDRALSLSESFARKWNKVEFWDRCLIYHIKHNEENDLPYEHVYNLLLEGLRAVKAKNLAVLCKLGVDWLTMYHPEKLPEFLEKGKKMHSKVSGAIKELEQDCLSDYNNLML